MNATQLALIAPVPARSEIKAFYGWLAANGIDSASSFSNGDVYRRGDYTVCNGTDGLQLETWVNSAKVDGVWVDGHTAVVCTYNDDLSAALMDLATR